MDLCSLGFKKQKLKFSSNLHQLPGRRRKRNQQEKKNSSIQVAVNVNTFNP